MNQSDSLFNEFVDLFSYLLGAVIDGHYFDCHGKIGCFLKTFPNRKKDQSAKS
jgi:hypothetical protein